MSEIWSFIADRFHRKTSKKVAKRVGFAASEPEDEVKWEVIFKYISILLEFAKAFKSPSCLELYDEMGKFEENYIEFLAGGIGEFAEDWTESNWSQFFALKGMVSFEKGHF